MKTAAKKNKRSTAASRSKTAKRKPVSSRTKQVQRTKRSTPKPVAKKKSAPVESGEDQMKKYFNDLLKDTLNAEKQLVKALPRLAKASTSNTLRKAFEKHLGETEKQVTRLEKVFAACGFKVAGKKCEAMEGLVKEGAEAIEETPKGTMIRDVALIVAAQKVEHYEMAAYGSLRSIAAMLGFDKAADLLQKTLDEEGAADKKLTEISGSLNPKATGSPVVSKKASSADDSAKSKETVIEKEEEVEDAIYLDADEEKEEEGEGHSTGKTSGSLGNSL